VPYTRDRPPLAETPEKLRARIPGWGVDKNPADRPSVPRLQLDAVDTGAHWDFPTRQPQQQPRERSMEHAFLTPVFGTAQPLKGLSGAIRRHAYRRYSEGRAAHWLLLMAGDRVDVAESRVASLVAGKPDRLLNETGVTSEASHRGLASRLGRRRSDVNHHWIDPAVTSTPWIAVGAALAAVGVLRRVRRG
jgi:hypothetical protein